MEGLKPQQEVFVFCCVKKTIFQLKNIVRCIAYKYSIFEEFSKTSHDGVLRKKVKTKILHKPQ